MTTPGSACISRVQNCSLRFWWCLMSSLPGASERCTPSFLLEVSLLYHFSIVIRNPVYHQVVFATIMVAVAARTTYMLKCTDRGNALPSESKSTIVNFFNTGLGLFAFGFFVWNMDNIFCRRLTGWKVAVGWPIAFILEGGCHTSTFCPGVPDPTEQGIHGGTS